MKKLFTFLFAVCIFASVSAQINDGAESYTTFTVNPTGTWTWVDVDQSITYGIVVEDNPVVFENSGAAMCAIVFDPSATVPAITANAHSGSKFFAFFAAIPSSYGGNAPNNDWMISPRLTSGGTLTFWARSYVADYGLERFKVLTSTTDNQTASFTAISTGTYVEAPIEWTQYTYTIPATAKYFAIQCVTNDAFIFLLDDVQYTGTTTSIEESNIASSVYPNPASDFVTFVTESNINKVEIFNVVGQLIYSNVETNNQVMVNVRDFSNGVYIAKIYTNNGVSTQKFNVVK